MRRAGSTLKAAALDLWDESLNLILLGLVGGLLGVLLVPIPFVLAAHYGVAARIPERRVIGWREWLGAGREHARFFYGWGLLVLLVSVLLLSNIVFYGRMGTPLTTGLSLFVGGLLLLWWLPQPLVPALYLQQEDQRLRVALRNAAILTARAWGSILLLWLSVALLALVLSYIALPLLALLPLWAALFSTRLVWFHLGRPLYR